MSSVGPTSLSAINLAGSIAGANNRVGEQDQVKAGQSAQKFQVEQAQALDKDVVEADMSADRDADGRQAYRSPVDEVDNQQETEAESSLALQGPTRRVPDARGERGNRLDLDA